MTTTEHVMRKEAIGMAQGITLAEYKRAEAELRTEEARIGFFAHAIIYVLVNKDVRHRANLARGREQEQINHIRIGVEAARQNLHRLAILCEIELANHSLCM